MKRPLALVLALAAVLLCGCAAGAPTTEPSHTLELILPTQTEAAETEPTVPTQPVVPTEPETEPTEPPVTEPPVVLYQNPFTGEDLPELTTSRPFCVVFNNSEGAMPQHGTSQADIMYEMLIEGETRCMGVFYNIHNAHAPFGSIRSARRDFIRVAMAYDGIFVHGGMSPTGAEYNAQDFFAETGWDHIDGVHGPYAEEYYYRTRQENYRNEHTLFIDPDRAIAYAEFMKCNMNRTEPIDLGLQFSDAPLAQGQQAEKITVWFNMTKEFDARWHKYTTMNYNAETGLYESFQYGRENIDGNTGNVLSFRNVLILRTKNVQLSNQLMKIDVVGQGEGYFACDGQLIPIRWSRQSEQQPYVYTLEDGTPLTLGIGKTYVAVIPDNGHVEVE